MSKVKVNPVTGEVIEKNKYTPSYLKKQIGSYEASNAGNPIRETFKLDKSQNKLVKTGEINQQDIIQSYYDETNYKDIIKRATGGPITDFIEQDTNATYGDISDVSDSIFRNIEKVKEGAAEFENFKQDLTAKLEAYNNNIKAKKLAAEKEKKEKEDNKDE